MKEKNKNILKGLGVGALACIGMFGLTGCSNIKVGQDKIDGMIETVEKVDIRLDEYKELLEQANRMTKEEIWNFAKTVDFNLMTNANGLRDNLVVTAVSEKLGLQQDIIYFYNSEEAKIFAELSGDDQAVITSVELWYQQDEENVVQADIQKAATGYMCDDLYVRGEDDIFENCIGVYRGGCPSIDAFELSYEHFNHYEILENGNIKLSFIKYNTYHNNEEEYYTTLDIYKYEYSLDNKLISLEVISRCVEKTENAEVIDTNEDMKLILSYGTVDVDMLESWVGLAEEKRNEQ